MHHRTLLIHLITDKLFHNLFIAMLRAILQKIKGQIPMPHSSNIYYLLCPIAGKQILRREKQEGLEPALPASGAYPVFAEHHGIRHPLIVYYFSIMF